ncbi:MAG: hypothetical protein ABSB19_07815 [Methylomonas sp.]|jgi:hypothetical protein
MNKSIIRFKEVIITLLLLASLLVFIPGELLISIILFGLVMRGSLTLIRMATEHDLKAKKIKGFDA